jgi:hypothetical protein
MRTPSMFAEHDDYVPVVPVDGDRLAVWVRALLVLIAAGLTSVLTTAVLLRPYDENGLPLKQTHRQLGLPQCEFYRRTGYPCPSCGFTTSFALTMHADPLNAMRANCVGAMLAGFCLLVVPWSVVSAWRGRYLFIVSAEKALIVSLLTFVVLMLVRWGLVLGLAWGNR